MGTYSKIQAMRIKNFRCLGDVLLDFSASPIVSLVAPNEAGKTSVIKAIISLMYNSNQREGKNYIRTGTDGYQCLMQFEDGKIVERARTEAANIYRLFENGKLISESLKLDNGEIPPVIKELMGVIEDCETGELMNIRTYEDMLLFVLSKGSDNYKTMYNALKVENITNAMKNGKAEAAALKNDISATEISMASFNEQIKAIRLHDMTPVVNIRDRVTKEIDIVNKSHNILARKEHADSMETKLGVYGELANASNINVIEASLLNTINNARNRHDVLIKEIAKSKDIEALENIEYAEALKMESILSRIKTLRELESRNKHSDGIDSVMIINTSALERMSKVKEFIQRLEHIDASRAEAITNLDGVRYENVEKMERVFGLLQKAESKEEVLKEHETELEEAINKLKELGHYDEELGGFVKKCDNCGETVVVTLNEMEAMI